MDVVLKARASEKSASSSAYAMLESTLQRKNVAAQRAADAEMRRDVESSKQVDWEIARNEAAATLYKNKGGADYKDVTVAQAAIIKGKQLLNKMKHEEDKSWSDAEYWDAKEKAAIFAKNQQVAEYAAATKLKAEQRARAASSAQRRALAQVATEETLQKKAEEEEVKFGEEEVEHTHTAKELKEEVTLLKKAVKFTGAKVEAEKDAGVVAIKKDRVEGLASKASHAEEAAKLQSNINEAKKAHKERMEYEKQEAALKATWQKIKGQAEEQTEAALAAEEEAHKKESEVVTYQVEATRKMAERNVKAERQRASAA